MNTHIDQLVRSVLKKNSLEQCSVQELQDLVRRYPYFGAAQLLLAKKLQSENTDQYIEQAQKTSLYVHNPLWLEHLLNDTGHAEIIAAKSEEKSSPEDKTESTAIATETEPEPIHVIADVQEEPGPAPVPKVVEPQPQSAESPKTDFVFEPYHTVDYFASQGIKIKEEEQPRDKFGKQLKSFTEWIRTMKRLPVSEIASLGNPSEDKKVEELAGHSIEDREVITEAMAAVWEKQGNTAKAIDIYNKLSLLDPSKSPYFAAKIEALKKTN